MKGEECEGVGDIQAGASEPGGRLKIRGASEEVPLNRHLHKNRLCLLDPRL